MTNHASYPGPHIKNHHFLCFGLQKSPESLHIFLKYYHTQMSIIDNQIVKLASQAKQNCLIDKLHLTSAPDKALKSLG